MTEREIRIVEKAIQQAKANGKKYCIVSIPGVTYAKNRKAQQELEREFCGYIFHWFQDKYKYIEWVTRFCIEWQ